MWKFIKCKEADGPEGKVVGGGKAGSEILN